MNTKTNKYTIYCDMDGVIANFSKEKNAVERFASEVGFFTKLAPIKRNLKEVKRMIKKGVEVKILSATPHTNADNDKHKWLDKHLPQVKRENRVFCRLGEDKSKYVKQDITKTILIDDYNVNIKKWQKSGGFGIKINPDKVKSDKVKCTQLNNLKGVSGWF